MQIEHRQGTLARELARTLSQTDTSVRRLSRLSGVHRRTLENWLYGHIKQPRHVESVLKVAHALQLPVDDTNRLLHAAGYPPIQSLRTENNSIPLELLSDWQLAPNILLGQKSASLPSQHNLPAANSPFLGRKGMHDELVTMLRRPNLRLITITGLGGTGKTRLALETARSLVGWFDHGVYFIPLDNVHSTEGFWEAILAGLHIPADGAIGARQLVVEYIGNKQILLLLDNFEHLMPVTAEINHLLSETQRLNLLITSRQALDLQAEQRYPIGGLSHEAGMNSPAYQLFLQTSLRRVPGYEPSGQEEKDILTLCAQVDGLPLAIELAATWSDVLSPEQILSHLQSDLQEVWHEAVDRPARQKSLWDLFDYTWQMLSAVEKEASIRLSVMRGTFNASTAMNVACCEPGTLKKLIQNSFIRHSSGTRLMLHPLVQQFLTEQAIRAGYAIEDLENHFMEVTLTWVSGESRRLRQTFAARCYQKIHTEWQHFERAWWLAVKRARFDLLESCWDIVIYFEARGTWGQGNAFFTTTQERFPASNKLLAARINEAQAYFHSRLYELPQAFRLAKNSLAALDDLGMDDVHQEAGMYARLVLFAGKHALSQAEFSEEDKQKFREVTGDHLAKFSEIAIVLAEGVKFFTKGDFVGSTQAFQNALDVCGPDAYTVPNIRCFLGISLRAQGQEALARQQFTLALSRALEIDIYPAVVDATYELTLLEQKDPSLQECRDVLEDLAQKLGSRATVGRVTAAAAIQYLNLGAFRRARQLARIGVGMLWPEVNNAERARVTTAIAQAYIAFGLIKTAPQVVALLAPK